MAENITTKSRTWLYPRFVQMLIDHAYSDIERDVNNDLLVLSHMSNGSLKLLARYHPNHPEPKKIAEFFGFIKDVNYVDPDPVNHQNWRNEEEMKEAAYADEKRGEKATPKAQKGEGSSSQPKKRQKKVAKTLLIDEPDVEEPVPIAEVEVEHDVEAEAETEAEPNIEVDVHLSPNSKSLLKKLKAFNAQKDKADVDAQKGKVADDIEGDDVNKSTTSSSSSSEDEIDEVEQPSKPPSPPPEPIPHQSPIHSPLHQSPPKQPTPPRQPSPLHLSPLHSPQQIHTITPPQEQTLLTSQQIFQTPPPSQPIVQTTPGSSGYKGFPTVPSNLSIGLEDIGDFDFANTAQVKSVEKKVDDVTNENKRLAVENKRVADREKILEMRVKKLESENKSLLKKIDTDHFEIDVLKNKELEAAKALKEHEFYMMNKVIESMLGKSIEQRFEEIQVEEVRAKRQAEIEALMRDKAVSAVFDEDVLIKDLGNDDEEVEDDSEEDDDEENDDEEDDKEEKVFSASSHGSDDDNDDDDNQGGTGVTVTEASKEQNVDDLMNDDANEVSGEADGEGEHVDDQNVDQVEKLILRIEPHVEEGEIRHTYTLDEVLKMFNVNEDEFNFDFEEELNAFDINHQPEYEYKYVEDADVYDRVEV
ncbi:glutamic acid-rich protein-like [Helianthus annuus]|uniref:glutamic acid-rich protein-like n=1 Tax=Helianthus annuus TaxID=4232 RepID=UPI000B8F5DA0|nr:glutamic acid-rich protein-like [Helianthus annuus]